MESHRLKELIDKYLEGRESPGEREELEQWYNSFEGRPGLDELLTEDQRKRIHERMFMSINEEIDRRLQQGEDAEAGQPVVRSFNWSSLFIAASVAALLLFLWHGDPRDGQPDLKPDNWTIITADSYQVKKVRLPDGSVVMLNAKTTIRFPQSFSETDREVWLDGEAYFEVVRDTSRAFQVHAGPITTRVLGTSFNIDAYAGDHTSSVRVTRGKVAVSKADQNLAILERGKEVSYDNATGKYSMGEFDEDAISWTKGRLAFKDSSFGDIVKELERWYGAEIRFSNSKLESCLLTASFNANVPLEKVLIMLCRVSGDKRVKQLENGSYLISGEPCK